MFQKTRALVGLGRAAPRVPALHRTPRGAGDTSLLSPRGRSRDCPPLQPARGPGSRGVLGEKQGPTRLLAQDSGVHSSCLADPWLQAAPGGGGNPGAEGAAGELSHRAAYIGKCPRPR